MAQVFEFTDYRAYLMAALDERAKDERGIKSRLAEAMGCQPGYLSQVLGGVGNLSLEQADAASQFFGHTEDQGQFFLFLVIHARAGTESLRTQAAKQIQKAREKQLHLGKRFKSKDRISDRDQAIFYGSWHYAAIMTALMIPDSRTLQGISERLKLSPKRTAEALEHLLSCGLVKLEGGKYRPGVTQTHLDFDSPLVVKHHLNWRLQAMQSIERRSAADLHFSSVNSLSAEDMMLVKSRIVETLEQIKGIIRNSDDEKVCAFSVDFFEL